LGGHEVPNKENIEDQGQVLAQIGSLLRETREAKGLTLEAAQEETKIRRHYLRALEQGQKEILPGEVYLKGFLKNYACFLGLPGEALVNRYSQSRKPQDDSAPGPKPRSSWIPPTRPTFRRRTLLVMALLLLLVVASIALTKGLIPPGPQPKEPPGVENQVPLAPPPENFRDQPDPEVAQVDVETVHDTEGEIIYRVTESPQIELFVTSDRCWIAIRTDNSAEIAETLTDGTRRTISATDTIWLRAGNPSVLDLTVNGLHVGKAGKPGQPRNITVKRQL
jgi:transcriptional regulator with XRE-family HTH domain